MRADLVDRADVLLSAAALLEGTGNAIDRREATALRSFHADAALALRALRDAPVRAVWCEKQPGLGGDECLVLSAAGFKPGTKLKLVVVGEEG